MENNSVEIRLALPQDESAIFSIEHNVFGEETRQSLNHAMAVDCFKYFVATIGKSVVGYCALSLMADEAELLTVAIKEEFRHKGVAKKMLEFAFDYAKNQGKTKVFLEVRVSNCKAIDLYKKLGFVEISRRKNYYKAGAGQAEDALIFQKDL